MNNAIFGVRIVCLEKLVVTRNSSITKAKFVNYKPYSNEIAKIKTLRIRSSKRGR